MTENGNSNSRSRRSFSLGGGRESVVILILLVFFSRLRPTLEPVVLVIAIGFGIYWYVRVARQLFGRAGLWLGIVTLLSGITWFGVAQYQAIQRFDDLVTRLKQFDQITIMQHGPLPSSPVAQISFERSVDDDIVEKIVEMPEFANVTHVYVKSASITDRGLTALDRFLELEYVYVDSPAISKEGIAEFEERHPKCVVIVPNH